MNLKRYQDVNGSTAIDTAIGAYFATVIILIALLPLIGGVLGIFNIYELSFDTYKTMIMLGLGFIFLFVALVAYFIISGIDNILITLLTIIGTIALGFGTYALFHYGIIPVNAVSTLVVGIIDIVLAVLIFLVEKDSF